MSLATHFKDLRVYQQAFESAMQIFELSKKWPKEERYALTDQVRRSSRSICANIAESWRKRRYPAHFVSKLSDADTEAAETEVWLDFALHCGYLNQTDYHKLYQTYETISGGLVKMMSNPDPWCSPTQLREEEAVYNTDTPTPPYSHTPTPYTEVWEYGSMGEEEEDL